MRWLTHISIAAIVAALALAGCGGRTDGGNPGNITTTSTVPIGEVDPG